MTERVERVLLERGPAMERFHGSAERLSEIRSTGIFDGVFTAASTQQALSHGRVVHRVNSPRPLSDFELNYSIEGAWAAALEVAGGDEAVAECIMSVDCPTLVACPVDDLAQQGWEHQRLRGKLAAKLGYTSVEMRDEHGTTWLCLPGCKIEVVAKGDRT